MVKIANRRKSIGAKRHKEEVIQKCIEYVKSGKKSMYAACKLLKLPISTVRYRVSDLWKHKNVSGPRSVLTEEEEQKIADWLIGMQERGFPVTRSALRFKVAEFLSNNPRETPFKNNRPGRKWFAAFMRRNPGFSLRTPEAISSASARVSEDDIRGWFRSIRSWLDENEMLDVLDYPERVFNGDETSFYLHPKSKEVIARTGSRNVYEVEQAPGKQNVTVMFAFSAAGSIVHPHVILPGKRLRTEVIEGFPDDWGIGQSERGWMDVNNFRAYIQNIFHPYLVQQNVMFPVIFFVDGHASHKSLEVADLCQSLGIILISLFPNTTHITQLADVAVFKPLKDEWRRQTEQWRSDHQGEILTIMHFGKVLEKTVAQGIKSVSIKNGFRVCGLCPFDPNNVDYSKCIARKHKLLEESEAPICEIISPTEQELSSLSQHDFPTSAASQYSMINASDSERDYTTVSLQTADQFVSVHINKIIQAVDMIGPRTMSKIQGDVGLLSKEERTIRFFYQEFVQPYINLTNYDMVGVLDINRQQTTSNVLGSPVATDPPVNGNRNNILMCSIAGTSNLNLGETVEVENMNLRNEIHIQAHPIVIEVPGDVSNQSLNSSDMDSRDVVYCQPNNASFNNCSTQNVGNKHATRNTEVCASIIPPQHAVDVELQNNRDHEIYIETDQTDSVAMTHEGLISEASTPHQEFSPLHEDVLKESTNKPKSGRTRRLSEYLKLPPTPRRSSKHRNYSKQYYPVLTAKQRLDEIRKKEEEKRDNEKLKLQRAKDREVMKKKREDIKKAKAEERERKKEEKEQKKEQAKLKSKRKRNKRSKPLIG